MRTHRARVAALCASPPADAHGAPPPGFKLQSYHADGAGETPETLYRLIARLIASGRVTFNELLPHMHVRTRVGRREARAERGVVCSLTTLL